MTSFGAKCDGGRKRRLSARNVMVGRNDVFRSFIHDRGTFLVFFPSSNKLNGFHIYNTLVSQISIEILGYFCQLPPFPSRLRTASTGRPSLAVLRHVGGGGHRRRGRRGRHRGHFKLVAIVYSALAVTIFFNVKYQFYHQ